MTSVNANSITPDYISTLLSRNGENELLGAKVAGKLETIEDKLLLLYSAPDKSDAAAEKKWLEKNGFNTDNFSTIAEATKAFEFKHQRAARAMEGLMQLMRTMHELLMSGIRNLRLN